MSSWTLLRHASASASIAALAAELAGVIAQAQSGQGGATLALAGGSTPLPLYRRLAAQRLAWAGVAIVPSDERWVAPGHPDHNLTQLQRAFEGAGGIRWLPLVPPHPAGGPDARFAERTLEGAPGDFALALLGMGADGHFASLFPGAPTLAAALDPRQPRSAIEVVPDPLPDAAPHPRISLTLQRLLRSRRVRLMVSGAAKLELLEGVLGGTSRHPVAALLASPHPDAQIHWSPA